MKRISILLGMGLFSTMALNSLVGCKTAVSQQKSEPAVVADKKEMGWADSMQSLQSAMADILPLLASPIQYSSPTNRAILQTKLSDLKVLSDKIVQNQKPDNDPSINFIGEKFNQNMTLAEESFKAGNFEFSRLVARNSMSQCVQCHTRLEYGPHLTKPADRTSIDKLNIVDRVQFLIASRYFNEAFNEIELALSSPGSRNISAIAWQKLTQIGIVINVRFNNDPAKTATFLNMIDSNIETPYFLKRNISYWKNSINDWRNLKVDSNYLVTAKNLISKAEDINSESHSDGGLVYYLVAERILHENLAFKESSNNQAEGLYHLGIIYDSIGDAGSWSMNEDYYELCIKKAPHSDIAKKCFAKLEESLVLDFAGSSGVNIPTEVQQRINQNRALSF